jgi:hypothetical protein
MLESKLRYCAIYKAKNGRWYLDLADREYGEYRDSTTYGPFKTEKDVVNYLDRFSNPGGWTVDRSGSREVPVQSPDGGPVLVPDSYNLRYTF